MAGPQPCRYICCKSFVCRSYENCRGVGVLFPFWNRASRRRAVTARLKSCPPEEWGAGWNKQRSAVVEAFELGFEVADALVQFRKVIQCRHHLQPFPVFDCGIPGIEGAGRDVVGHATLGSDDRAVADAEVAGGADLSGENAVSSDFRGTGKADLAAEQGIGADLRSVTDENQVVELGTAPDARFADRGAVHASVGLHFDVVLEDRGTRLRHLVPSAILPFGKTKAVTADDDPVLQNDAVPDPTKFPDDGVGVGEEIITDFRAAVDADETVQDGVAADLDLFFDVAIRADVRALSNPGGFRDDGRRVNPRSITRRLGEERDGLSESQIGICGAKSGERGQRRVALDGDTLLEQHSSRARGLQEREIFAVGHESHLIGSGMLNASDAAHFGVGWTLEATA